MGAPLVTPAIAHLKPGHYTFVLKHEEGRVLLRDSILGGEIWVSRAALEEESSGYWLIGEGPLPNEWRGVENHEADVVIGRCIIGNWDPLDPCGCTGGAGGTGGGGGNRGGGPKNPSPVGHGMPVYFFHPVAASLRLADTPVGYAPPRGPAAYFTVTYNHREVSQPATFTYSNLGPMWTYDWLSYIQEVPLVVSPGGNTFNPYVRVFLRRAGEEHYRTPDVNGVYPAHFKTRAVLVKVSDSPVRYERRLPDGSLEVFTQSNGAPSGERRIFLTSIVDPQGQALQITYDAQLRAVAFTDALGQVTTVSYDHPTDPLKITKVTDPFGRFATFTYTPVGQLASITDVIGLTSSFTYASEDFIVVLTTPYGTTTFRQELGTGYPKIIEATDPLGGTEHLEYHLQITSISDADPAAVVPTGFAAFNENLQWYNTFYWDKRQWALHPGDITKATRTKWLLHDSNPDDQNHGMALSIPHSIKQPLENKVWYAYPDQSSKRWVGSFSEPERVGRVLDDGTSQIVQTTYNQQGHVTSTIDPVGRRTSYVYAANGTDLLEVRQTTGSMNDLLATYSNYTATHLPQTITDAAGQSRTITYNAAGQVLTVTNAKSETTTNVFDTNGRLQSVTRPAAGATTTYTYDSLGRTRTVTDSDGYIVTMDYDALDRPTRTTYPDTTYEETVYDKLDPVRRRDRLGRRRYAIYDALGRITAAKDPLGRTFQQEWCACGNLEALIDAKGQKTSWLYDLRGRVTSEIRADSTTTTTYTYDAATGRVKTVTDPKQQVTTYTYNSDHTLQSVVYSNAQIATPSVSYTYESSYKRRATMVDVTGTTSYAYRPVGGLGAFQLASSDGPLANDTTTYTYDELGRVITRAVDGIGATQTYDTLGRVITETNPLGTFNYGYDNASSRLASVAYPNGQTSAYAYFGNADDHRLQQIHHKQPGGATQWTFEYTYDRIGNILTWQQQVGSASPVLWAYTYDLVDQLLTAVQRSTGATPTVLKRYSYTYDLAGNRTTEQIDDTVIESTYDILNRLVQQRPGGGLRLVGSVDEPATVTIQGQPAAVSAGNTFAGATQISPGTNMVTIRAADLTGNVSTANYQVEATGSTRTFVFDANGSLVSDGQRTFAWNAANRAVSIQAAGLDYTFVYNGMGRVSAIERQSGNLVESEYLIWCGLELCQRKTAQATERYFRNGYTIDATQFFVTNDHLNSVSAVTNNSGSVLVSYEYTPFGKRVRQTPAGVDAPFGFTGHFSGVGTDLAMTIFREYDAELGRWTKEDPLGVIAGTNRYIYVENRPLSRFDPFGLAPQCDGCTPDEARRVRDADDVVCRNASSNSKCQAALSRYTRPDCVRRLTCDTDYRVVCYKRQPDLRCGGPMLGDDVSFVGLYPNAFVGDWSNCGPVADTLAHELAHRCGVGHDGDRKNNKAHFDNFKIASEVGMACGRGQ